jgi:hypothetical protein
LSNPLLLEEIVQGATRVVRTPRRRRCFALHGGTERKEGTVIASALVGDAFWDRLSALKPLAWGKVCALLAGMQLGSALGTLAKPIS